MICYYYPPLTDVGCVRSIYFSEYFRRYGWIPHVISAKNPDRTFCSIGNELPPAGMDVQYSYSVLNPYRILGKLNGALTRALQLFGIKQRRNYFNELLCIPDLFIGWIPLTILKGLQLVRKYKIDYVYVSCSPFSAAIIGVMIKKITGRALVLDFRDPFAMHVPAYENHTWFRKRIDKAIEKHLLSNADLFVLTTEETRKDYVERYPQIENKTYTIYNGFEPKQYLADKPSKYSKFTIVYAGQFYFYARRLQTYTNMFFEALLRLKKGGRIDQDNFQFLFYGSDANEMESISREYGVDELVIVSQKIPHQEVIRIIQKSQLQLLRILKPMISTKLFEGIALNIPLLATIPGGEVEEIIRKYSPGSCIITDESSEEVADAILDAMWKCDNDKAQDNHVEDFLEEYSRENQALKLMDIIKQSSFAKAREDHSAN